MSRVVTSPAGERIEVVEDQELATILGLNRVGLGQALSLNETRQAILETLWTKGQVVDRPTGRATAKLAKRAGGMPSLTFTHSLASPIMSVCVDRDMNAKRTYSLRLSVLPERWLAYLERLKPSVTNGHIEPEPTSEPEPVVEAEPEVVSVEVNTDGLEPMGLLTEAIGLIARAMPLLATSTPSVEPDVLDRLARTLEDNERMRRKLAQANDLVLAVSRERDGLRQAKRALEANLSEMAKGAFNEQTYRRFVDLDRMIREAPRSAKDAS